MAPEILLALICLVCLGISDFLYRFGQRYGLMPGPFMLIQNIAYIATALVIGSSLGELQYSPALIYGIANGVMAFTAFLFILLALKSGEATALVPIVRLNFAVTGLLTVAFLGEPLTAVRFLAVCLVAVAIILMGPGVRAALGSLRPLGFAIGAMMLFGLIGLLYKLALRDGATPGAMVFAQSLGVLLMAAPFAIYRKEKFSFRGGRFWIPVVCGVLTSVSYISLATAFTFGDAVVVAPIAQLSFVLTALLAIMFLGERPGLRKIVGLVAAVTAVLIFGFA